MRFLANENFPRAAVEAPLFLPLAIGQAVITAIASRTDWEGHFSVVEIGRVRMRILVP